MKVFTDYLPVPAGGMGLRWKADGTGLENYEITTDFVLRVVRFVRVAHDAAAPTLTGGVPGDDWRGGAFATPPVAGNGGVLLGSWPANPDFATYDFYQFSAEVDTASAAAIAWTNDGKRDNAESAGLNGRVVGAGGAGRAGDRSGGGNGSAARDNDAGDSASAECAGGD